jgi:hypothetical protein
MFQEFSVATFRDYQYRKTHVTWLCSFVNSMVKCMMAADRVNLHVVNTERIYRRFAAQLNLNIFD